MSRTADIIKSIISFLNYNKDDSIIPQKIRFDLLSIKDDSICLSTANQNLQEQPTDVTGGAWVQGTIQLKLIYRKLVAVSEESDYSFTDKLDYLSDLLVKSYKQINDDAENWFIYDTRDKQPAKLEKVYENGTKDYSTIISVVYQRDYSK